MSMPTPADGSAPGYFGVYPALVTDLVDPDSLGRVEVRFPWLGADGDRDVRAWATLCSPYADDQQGLQIVPEVDSQVVVAFEAGNLRRPYVIGCAWNGVRSQPEAPTDANDLRVLKTRSGSSLEFDDGAAGAKITVVTSNGNKVVLDDGSGGSAEVRTASGHHVTMDQSQLTVSHALGCSVTLTATAVQVNGNVQVTVTAPMVSVSAPMTTFSGVLQATTIIATTSVVSPSYSPGVGNIL
ncbi:uncharacterized protein involved in type VI secretion and phage assembly [Actinoplanes tereljensis]|uniref:Phage tail protein n=1 Tax=Paractinoplanes tereljensis TaxID=571912 RepID=A0A919NGS8_9ACTN|nr:phage baseplate assembly protein V [Actinoplanes tereljensis]GIF18188.1 phage tail protein [Actinoplanes tereljensis]